MLISQISCLNLIVMSAVQLIGWLLGTESFFFHPPLHDRYYEVLAHSQCIAYGRCLSSEENAAEAVQAAK